MSSLTRKISIAIAVTTLAGCGSPREDRSPIDISSTKEAWNDVNDPLNLRDHYELRFSSLPTSGELSTKPWTDTYWPNYRGGLASRWNDPSAPDAFTYPLHSQAEIAAMSGDALARLSPAEKYDLFVGNFAYPLVTHERRRTSPNDPSWYGLCHGWAPASINFIEPKPVQITGAGGVVVPFGSSDIKALLLFAQQEGQETRAAGDRCNADDGDQPECRDINAGSFHVILANQIALLRQGFVAEVSRGEQIWNQPVFGFDSEIRGETNDVYPSAAPGTVRIVTVRTKLRYIVEVGPRWEPLPFDDHPEQAASRVYDYKLEIDGAGMVVGGEWLSRDHPDFFWTQTAPLFKGYFRALKGLYEAATRNG